jgi:hypothetical protein
MHATASTASSLDYAWKVHDAIGDWTARVEVKASVVLGLEGASIALIADGAADGVFKHLSTTATALLWTSLICLFGSTLVSIAAVFPQLRRRASRSSWANGVIYFGHVRLWKPNDLAEQLTRLDDSGWMSIVAQQLVDSSKVAWRKHAFMQVSMALLLVSVLCGAGCFVAR